MPIDFNPNVRPELRSDLLDKLFPPVKTEFNGSDGKDTITVTPGKNGGVNVTVNGETYYVPKHKVKDIVINAGAGKDTVTVDPRVTQGITINGGDGNDTIKGGSGNDVIDGGAGDDHIYGRGGNDEIKGGTGKDHIWGGSGKDDIDGGAGVDHIWGGSQRDKIHDDPETDYVNHRGPNHDGINRPKSSSLFDLLRKLDLSKADLSQLMEFLQGRNVR